MPEQVQNILTRIGEWWKKFNIRQKALMLSLTAIVLLSLGILAVVVTRPTYVPLIDCENAKMANEVKQLLDDNGSIKYKVTDTIHFEVEASDENDANMLLGSNNISTMGYDLTKADISKVVDGSFSTTEADKQKLYKQYLETKMAEDLASNVLVESANVSLDIPVDDGTLISRMQDSSASVSLALTGEMDEEQAYAIARFVATALGNDSLENITIINQKNAKILFSGADMESDSMIATNNLSTQQKASAAVEKRVKDMLVDSGMYSDVQVGLNLDMSFDRTERTTHDFSHPEGQDNGELTRSHDAESSSTGGQAAVPGTDSNDENTYLTQDGEVTSSSTSESDRWYSPNEEITKTTNSGGNINYDTGTVAVAATRFVIYDEAQLKASGELDDMTFDEFKAAHSDPVQVNASQEDIDMVAKATGFQPANVSFVCYERPQFVEAERKNIGVTDILQIVLAVLIFALLGYVVFRSTRKQKEEEPEPEISVDALLEATADVATDSLEDIGYAEKSETRLLIEKFVDENPDAVALLLRNWLNEDWE